MRANLLLKSIYTRWNSWINCSKFDKFFINLFYVHFPLLSFVVSDLLCVTHLRKKLCYSIWKLRLQWSAYLIKLFMLSLLCFKSINPGNSSIQGGLQVLGDLLKVHFGGVWFSSLMRHLIKSILKGFNWVLKPQYHDLVFFLAFYNWLVKPRYLDFVFLLALANWIIKPQKFDFVVLLALANWLVKPRNLDFVVLAWLSQGFLKCCHLLFTLGGDLFPKICW